MLDDQSERQGRFATLAARCRYCARPEHIRATIKIALVVGILLSAINEGDALVAGHLATALAVKVPLNFVVPFVVSNLGLLAAESRTLTRRGPRS